MEEMTLEEYINEMRSKFKRHQIIDDYEALQAEIKALQKEVCEYTKIIADDDGVIGVQVEDIAKQRGWHGLFEGGK